MLLDDISNAKTGLTNRMGELLRKTGPRYSLDNAGQAANGSTWDERFLGADAERLRQLNLLSDAVASPEWTQKLDNEVTKRKDAGFAAADYGHQRGEDARKTTAAGSGTAGGSWDAVVQGQNAQELASTKARVTQQVAELKAAGIQNLEEMGRQLLSKALAGRDESQALGVQSQADGSRYATDQLSSQNNEMYRGLLANAMSGFISQSVTPAVTGGFQSADRWNQQQRDTYSDARDAGSYRGTFRDWEAANGGSRSWWNL